MAVLIAVSASAQSPAPHSFTYQAYVEFNGQALDAPADFRFSLWDAETAGNQVGTTLVLDGVSVVNGLANVELDFGLPALSNGDARWIEGARARR